METVVRVTLFYVLILLGLRVMGKREFSQLSSLELVTLLLIPELVSQSLLREDFSFTNGIIAVCTVFAVVYISSQLQHHSKAFADAVSSAPTVLVERGRFVQRHLDEERVSPDEVFAELHKVGLTTLDQVRWVILEADGRMSVIPDQTERQVQPPREKGRAEI